MRLWVTFPEGFTAREIGRRLAARRLGDAAAFERYAARTRLDIDGTWTRSLEGYLFPEHLPDAGRANVRTASRRC